MKIRNLLLALKDQGPVKRFVRNFIVTGHVWGLFHKNSHISQGSGKPKVAYGSKATAEKAAKKMSERTVHIFQIINVFTATDIT